MSNWKEEYVNMKGLADMLEEALKELGENIPPELTDKWMEINGDSQKTISNLRRQAADMYALHRMCNRTISSASQQLRWLQSEFEEEQPRIVAAKS